MGKTKEKASSPYSLIIIAVLVLYVLSFIIPSGTYERIDGIVNPEKFEFITKQFLTPWKLIGLLGGAAAEQFGTLWINMFVTGGTLAIMTETGVLDRIITAIVEKLQNKALVLVPFFSLFMFLTGMVGTFINSALALLPIGLLIAKKLKVDNIFAFGIIFLSSWAGLWMSGINPVALPLAQEIAGVPPFSGVSFRTLFALIVIVVIILYLVWYARRVRKNPEKTFMNKITLNEVHKEIANKGQAKTSDLFACIVFLGGILFFGIGTILWKFGTSEFTGTMLVIGIFASIATKLTFPKAMQYFTKGAASMMVPVLILFFSQGLSIILTQTSITDTLIYFLAMPLKPLGGIAGGLGIFGINSLINMILYAFVPHVAMVMPIMAPLASAIHVAPDTAVLAVQYGAGITDFITPFNGVMLAGLAIVGVKYKEWMKFILPITCIIGIIMIVALIIAGTLGM
ncbi:hypothetical protein RV11_GL000279 [Enterococcus phoeniculicola]|uniref:C4-dicarboxylate anaerobic carrier n=1 Tax=Enterococcus phoeniculicola ATCC BAA-412 TaxID=1158610 RepID=R3TSC0_9ENTE|nr:Na+/H+ antiporter NhaC family protein [Enterococcus phoeniculicola]EOL44023.1 hypothetical protein UC3_01653 [Enterococcus phoeniculicola ATCC BAA-412]EOT75125.1 hypothetical protein I589_02725 [Enterococcus phoeniculicola ATCC BAA-412]OJG71573.1 hypothetical protein RV11_GL000279 [Enterococcus phoeniculicola]